MSGTERSLGGRPRNKRAIWQVLLDSGAEGGEISCEPRRGRVLLFPHTQRHYGATCRSHKRLLRGEAL